MSKILSKAERFIQTHFLSANPPNIIPSSREIIEGTKNAIANIRSQYEFAQREQSRFQEHLQEIGISGLSNIGFQEAAAGYIPEQPPRKQGQKQTVIRLKWDSLDPNS